MLSHSNGNIFVWLGPSRGKEGSCLFRFSTCQTECQKVRKCSMRAVQAYVQTEPEEKGMLIEKTGYWSEK